MKKHLFVLILGAFLTACSQTPVKKPNEVSYGRDPGRLSANTSAYVTRGLCNGLPRVQEVRLAPGFCLGLVDNGEGLGKPRYTLQIDANNLLLVDMGGWAANTGKLYILTKQNNRWVRRLLLGSEQLPNDKKCIMDRPNQLLRGPGNEIYLTSTQCIATVQPFAANAAAAITIKVSNLPADGLHPLKAIAFDAAGNMYMNVGSISDNCELETGETCRELENRALIRKYHKLSDGSYDSRFSVFARGQRNSMALHWDEKNQALWAAENSRDYIERKNSALNGQEKPSDEFNIITENAQLDWPYCYDASQVSPEFPHADCSRYTAPHLLYPAHSAPLSFLMYTGTLFPSWYHNRLLVTLHGYKSYGHRIVTYRRDADLRPMGEPLSVVYGWDAKPGRMVGAPVGITQGLDGSVFITEDTPKKILQLYYNASEGNGTAVAELRVGNLVQDQSQLARDFQRAEERRRAPFESKLNSPNAPLFTQIQSRVLDQHCARCHAGLTYPGMQILKYDDVGNYKKLKDILMPLLTGNGMPQMPLGGLPDDSKDSLMALVQRWIDAGYPAP